MRSLLRDVRGFVDVGIGISIGILFAGLMVIAYIIWTLREQLVPAAPTAASPASYNLTYRYIVNSTGNITGGFDNTITLLLIVVVVWLLALAIMALLVIKKKSE